MCFGLSAFRVSTIESKYFSLQISLLQTYADEDHRLTNVVEHVYKSMEHYLKNCLSLDPDSTEDASKQGHI